STAILEDAVALQRRTVDRDGMAQSLCVLGSVQLVRGDCERAAALFAESLEVAAGIGYPELIGYCVSGLGQVAVARGEPARGATLLAAAEAILERVGAIIQQPETQLHEDAVAAARRDLGSDDFATARDGGRALAEEEVVTYALGGAAAAPSHPDGAADSL